METPSQPRHRRLKARRRTIVLTLFKVVVVTVVCVVIAVKSTHINHSQPIPPRKPIPSNIQPHTTKDATPSTPSSPQPAPFKAGRAVQLYVPSTNRNLVINDPVLKMPSSCRTLIEPPLSGPNVGRVFQCMDFAMPGPQTPSLAVLAGHSSLHLQTVFNRLYRQGTALIGRHVLLRTVTSGNQWLQYKVQKVYTPLKTRLPYMDGIWGSPERSTAGRLVLVTCLQNADGSQSDKNFIVVAQFMGIR